jgi:hypothetical protein
MKRAILLFACLLTLTRLYAAPAKSTATKSAIAKPAADPRSALDTLLDFSFSLKEIDRAAKTGTLIPAGKFFILNGTLGSVLQRSRDGEELLAEVELVNGQWQGYESVEMYRAKVIFSGEAFASFFAKDSPERLKTGDLVLVLASYKGISSDYTTKEKIAVLQAEMIRFLD